MCFTLCVCVCVFLCVQLWFVFCVCNLTPVVCYLVVLRARHAMQFCGLHLSHCLSPLPLSTPLPLRAVAVINEFRKHIHTHTYTSVCGRGARPVTERRVFI